MMPRVFFITSTTVAWVLSQAGVPRRSAIWDSIFIKVCNAIGSAWALLWLGHNDTNNTRLPGIPFSHLPFAWSRLLEHERTKGCDTLIQVARLKTVLVTNAGLKEIEGSTSEPGNTRRSQTGHLSVQAQAPLDWKFKCESASFLVLLYDRGQSICLNS